MSSTNSPVDQPAQTISVQTLDTGSPVARFDQMERDLKRLRQDAEQLTASIQQLEVQKTESFYGQYLSSDAWVLGIQGLVLGLGVLVAGALLSRLMQRWFPVRAHTPPADFMESALYLSDVAPVAPPVRKTVKPADAPVAVEAEPSGWKATPSTFAKTPQAQAIPHDISEDSSPPETAQGFDFKAAASDVERVRRSLAEKRAERWRMRHTSTTTSASTPMVEKTPYFTDISPESVLSGDVDNQGDSSAQESNLHPERQSPRSIAELDTPPSMDLLLEFDLDLDEAAPDLSLPNKVAPDKLGFDSETIPEPEIELSVQKVEDDAESIEAALSVKLALAQEFHALGLITQATELANEVVASGNRDMVAMASEVLSRISLQQRDAEQQQNDYAALINSLRAVEVKSHTE